MVKEKQAGQQAHAAWEAPVSVTAYVLTSFLMTSVNKQVAVLKFPAPNGLLLVESVRCSSGERGNPGMNPVAGNPGLPA